MGTSMTLNRTVALVGMMGAGKTSIGKRLAVRLGVAFKDADHEIATGGGAYMDAGTRAAMQERAFTIWLKAPLELLLSRTAKRATRPLLNNADPKGTLERLLTLREPVYAQADYVLESMDGPHEKSVEQVVEALKERGLMMQEAAP
jgi:shikimate kinase